MMRQYTVLAYISAILLTLCACNNNEDELTPYLSHDSVQLCIGEETTIEVHNAQQITATSGSGIISVSINGKYISISAIQQGEASIRITADGTRLLCKVTVTQNTDDEQPDTPKDPDDTTDEYNFDDELGNDTSRYISSKLSLKYNVPGIIFSFQNSNCISIVNINNSDNVVFSFEGQSKVGILNSARLTVNNEPIDIQSAEIERLNSSGMWIHIITSTGEHIPLVVTDL